jgi:glycerol-3-phosphate acyltransferase PlsY
VIAAFLLGSLPWGLWIGRLVRGIDVRRHGSGNLGATNVYRLLGPRWGITVLLLDAAKGVAAVLLARAIAHAVAGPSAAQGAIAAGAAPGGAGAAAGRETWAGFAALAGSILGHSFSPFAGFRGGKGVATAAGAWGALAPIPLACALGAWAVVFAATRIVSAGSVVAALVLPAAVACFRRGEAPLVADPIFWLSVVTALLLIARHRSNIDRLLHGRERPLKLRGPESGRPSKEAAR